MSVDPPIPDEKEEEEESLSEYGGFSDDEDGAKAERKEIQAGKGKTTDRYRNLGQSTSAARIVENVGSCSSHPAFL